MITTRAPDGAKKKDTIYSITLMNAATGQSSIKCYSHECWCLWGWRSEIKTPSDKIEATQLIQCMRARTHVKLKSTAEKFSQNTKMLNDNFGLFWKPRPEIGLMFD